MQLDLTRPNAGRMVDFWLGGSHNFEIDRQLADKVSKTYPIMKQLAEEARAMVKPCVRFLHDQGIRCLIDFGASLPTCNNTHLVAQAIDPTIKVVYSDIDTITVAYGQELLRGNPNAIYLQCDAANPSVVFDSPLTRELLGSERRVGFIYLNLAHIMNDSQVRSSWTALYDWAAPGSYLAVAVASESWLTEPDLMAVLDSYSHANIETSFRSPERLAELYSPWRMTAEGLAPNWDWGLPPKAPPTRVIAYSMMLYK